MNTQLQLAAGAFGLNLTETMVEQFEQYWKFLVKQNELMNLTAITDRDEVARKHFLDSLSLALAEDLPGKRLIDVGTGAGFPGLPLKIAMPSLEVTLLDSLNKRVGFLQETCDRLGLEKVTCVHGRAEEFVKEAGQRESYDFATSRAVAKLNLLAEMCLPYVKVGGAFLAMKTLESDGELEEARGAVSVLGGQVEQEIDYPIPGTEIVHRIVVIRKVGETPERYPRRFARMQKQPLV